MIPVIDPETINTLCGNTNSTSGGYKNPFPENEYRQSMWDRFKAWVKNVCELFKPVVEVIVPIFSATAALLRAITAFRGYNGGGAACATV